MRPGLLFLKLSRSSYSVNLHGTLGLKLKKIEAFLDLGVDLKQIKPKDFKVCFSALIASSFSVKRSPKSISGKLGRTA